MKQLNILILDDDSRIRNEITEFLNDFDYKVFQADRPSSGQLILDNEHIDIMIIDVNLPEKDGLTYLEEIKQQYPDLEVIVITGFADIDKAVKALRLGAIDFLSKPLKLIDLHGSIIRTKRYVELSNSVRHAKETIDVINNELKKITEINFIGNSSGSKKVIQDIISVAQSPDTSVLVTGESGTGKELVARSIHLLSCRAKNPFIAVNSSAIPETLFESELFGYKKGAFTGASESKPGWFELADKGTLFLDEISEMNPVLQAKILRVLEDKKIRRLGACSEKEFDVRIISASNQDFSEIITQNKFRQDLYYRLAVFKIHLPPLRERKDDIPLLTEFYVKHFADKMNKKIIKIESNLMSDLSNYYFPGNIRELRNLIERAVILCNDGVLKDNYFDCFTNILSKMKEERQLPNGETENENLDLDYNEKQLILKALAKSDSNKAQAAKLLNITWQSLDRRMKKFRPD